MDLARDLEALTRKYLGRRVPLDALHKWLVSHVQAVADCPEPSVQHLADRIWILICEFDYGDRSESSVRAEVRVALDEFARTPIGLPRPH